jgi:hypothetical protein
LSLAMSSATGTMVIPVALEKDERKPPVFGAAGVNADVVSVFFFAIKGILPTFTFIAGSGVLRLAVAHVLWIADEGI